MTPKNICNFSAVMDLVVFSQLENFENVSKHRPGNTFGAFLGHFRLNLRIPHSPHYLGFDVFHGKLLFNFKNSSTFAGWVALTTIVGKIPDLWEIRRISQRSGILAIIIVTCSTNF